MFRISLLFACAAAALAQPGERTVMSGNMILRSGVVFDYRAVLRPAGTSLKGFGAGGVLTDSKGNIIHRYMIDENNKLYFGYDVVVGSADVAGAYLVTFQPLSDVEKIRETAGLKPAPPPLFPAPQMMHDGEIIELDLMVNPDGNRRLTDIIAIQMHESAPQAAKTIAAPRDFTVDDGPINFDTTRYSFWERGQEYKGMSGFTGKPGKTLWFTIPGDGHYVVSLTPHEGFAKSGTIRDNVVAFGDSGMQYELRLRTPVAGAGKAWNLYVMHSSGSVWDHVSGMQFGTDRLENLLTGSK